MTAHQLTLLDPGLVSQGGLRVRALLVRKEETYRHYGVDRICENHRNEVALATQEHVLQATPGLEGAWHFDDSGPRKSLCFNIGPTDETGCLETLIGLKSVCNDSCLTCSDPSFRQTESSRDLLLVLTLESCRHDTILARRTLTVWPKAVVRPKDLNKPERRKPKGGAAKLIKMRELVELRASGEAGRVRGRAGRAGQGDIRRFSVVIQVDSQHDLPTTSEILESTLNYSIRNAKSLHLSKSQFIDMIVDKYDKKLL